MAQVITTPIPNIQTPWENYSGESVENFIKDTFNEKYGWLYRTNTKLSDGFYHIYAFASQDTYQEWRETGDSSLIIQNISLPNPENASYAVELTTNSSTTKLVNLGNGVKIGLKFTSTSTDPYTLVTTDTGNDGTLYIQKYMNGYWITQTTMQIESVPIASDTYTQVDITEYLSDGDNKIRVRVDDNVNGQSSANIVFNSIVNTTLALENVTSQTNPLTAMTFNYYIQGRITKTLNIKLTTTNAVLNYTFPIGDSIYTESYYTTPVISGQFNTGIISVESWLSVDDYPELESEHVYNEYYFVDVEHPDTNPVLIINNLAEEITNYTPTNFFDFILFNQSVDVNIKIYDSTRTYTYLSYTYNDCPVNTLINFSNELQIESEGQTITCIIVITSGATTLATETISVDNSVNFNPTAGADFVLNPQTRSNYETNKNTIINQMNGAVISSTFTNFDFINDGWVKDEDNISVLRVPTGRTLTINYDVLNNLSNGTTFEMDFKVRNVFDDDNVVFKFCEYSGTTLYGFEMKSLEAAFGTQQNTVRRDQDVMFGDETRTHLVVNIIPNLSNSGLNYIRIFINGIINREMLYNNNDIFKLSTNLPIVIGGQDVDIDIYSIRVYKKSLSSENIRQDYISALPTKEDKLAFKDANNILANSVISYDLASNKYNTIVWTGIPASYQNQGEGIGNGTLQINILGRPECSGTINNMTCKGQGSSSKGYWKWNQQYGFSDDSVWIDGNGVTRGKYYKITEDAQPAKKLVSKINWASSMQSHKIGATAMYDDLWKRVIGGNSITNTEGYESCRIAVKEEPFLFFTKSSENANPVFYGLVTFGPGKADKPTFGYYPSVFPYQLWIEGSDNGLPLISRQVPWMDDEVTYNADEEFFEYANSGNIDVNIGDLSLYTAFQTAFNFTFLHSQRLRPFTGSIPSNADVTYQYWDDSTMNVYRYDYITEQWVNASASKTGEVYDVLNLETQTGLLRTNYSSNDEYNAAVIAWRTADFRANIGTYYNVNDCLFTIAFLKTIAASDNRCKNTYEYLDPVTRLICLWQDDMDTILATDNVGRKNKPYYVEEHDRNASGNTYWNGEDNVFYNLMETAFATELRGMINSIFAAMRAEAGTVQQCMYNYFFYVQNYFPAVAYNETTRLLYEQASVAQSQGTYQNGTPAISQALGDQLQTELMWWKRREPYMESLAASFPFAARSTGSLGFRANTMLDAGGNASAAVSFNFDLTPQQWLYPKVGAGQSLGGDNTRVEALDNYITNTINTSSDTDCFIYGADYYVYYGEFVNIPVGEVFELTGAKLLSFSADSRNATVAVQFRPTAMTVNCPNLRSLTLYGISSLTGSLDLSACTKLQTLDLRGTNITSVILPESYDLTTVYLPSLAGLYINNVPNLININIPTYENFVNINTDRADFAMDVMLNATNIRSLTLNGININTNSSNANAIYNVLVDPTIICTITGHIYLAKALTIEEVNALKNKFGSNVFNSESSFYIDYITTPISTITLTSDRKTILSNDSVVINSTFNGNELPKSYNWTISGTDTYILTKSLNSVTIASSTVSVIENITITYTITKQDNTVLTQTITLNTCPYQFNFKYTNPSNEVVHDSVFNHTFDALFNYHYNAILGPVEVECNDENVTYTFSGTKIEEDSESDLMRLETDDNYLVFEYGDIAGAGNTPWMNIPGFENWYPNDAIVDSPAPLFEDALIITISGNKLYIPFNVQTCLYRVNATNNPASVNCPNGNAVVQVNYTYPVLYQNVIHTFSCIGSYNSGYTIRTIYATNITNNRCDFDITGLSNNGGSLGFGIGIELINPYGGNTSAFSGEYQYLDGVKKNGTIALVYQESGPTVIAEYSRTEQISSATETFYMFSGDSNFAGWDKENNQYVEQTSCSLYFPVIDNTFVLTWDDVNKYYSATDSNLGTLKVYPYYNARITAEIPIQYFGNGAVIGSTIEMRFTLNLALNTTSSFGSLAYALKGVSELKSVELQGVSSINAYAFSGCTSLTSITLPNTLTSIGSSAFSGCTSLTSITLPNTLTSIGTSAFYYCTNLTSITLPNTLTTIGSSAFRNCISLTSIIIPSSVTSIGDRAFEKCDLLSSITINRSTAPNTASTTWGYGNSTTGYNSGTTNVLYVPQGATGYDTTNWTSYLLNASYGKFTLSATL